MAATGRKIFGMRRSIGRNLPEAPPAYAADIFDLSVGHHHPSIQIG
jgi:hypothetical protein